MSDTEVTRVASKPRGPQPMETKSGDVAETNALGHVRTPTGRKLQGIRAIYAEPIIQHGVANELMPPGSDQYTVLPSEYERYGIGDGEVHCWRRSPDIWSSVEMSDRILEARRQTPGLRAIFDEQGQPIMSGDQWLCAMPRPDESAQERQSAQRIDDYLEGVSEKSKKSIDPEIPRYNPGDFSAQMEEKERKRQENVANGIIGATKDVDYFDAMATQVGREKIDALEEKYRNGGHHFRPKTEAQENRAEGMRSAIASAKSGTKFVHGSMPEKIGLRRPEAFKEAVAASSGRGKR